MITAQCPACFHVFQTDDRYAGTAVDCHQCGTPTLVPAMPTVQLTGHLPAGAVEDATGRVIETLAMYFVTGLRYLLILAILVAIVTLVLWPVYIGMGGFK